MTTDNNMNSQQMRSTKAAMLLEQVKALGLSLDDLFALKQGGQLPDQITFHEYLPTVRKAAPTGSIEVRDSYWKLLDIGMPNLCACLCDACLALSAGRDGGALGMDRCVPGRCRGQHYAWDMERRAASSPSEPAVVAANPDQPVTP